MKILFFASIRESIKESEISLGFDDKISVLELKANLIERFGEQHFGKNTLCAVNQELVKDDCLVLDSDEVAFYPPVTGG